MVLTRADVFVILISLVIAFVVGRNPYWIGRSAGPPPEGFKVFTSHPILDGVLRVYQDALGDDFDPYRNHNLRVLSFAAYHLGDRANDERLLNLTALALAYHDIGLWTDGGELDYLSPSVTAMEGDLYRFMLDPSADLPDDVKDELDMPVPPANLSPDVADFVRSLTHDDAPTQVQAIWQHHKFTSWTSPSPGLNVDEDLVNAIRKGDWADATVGAVRFGLPASCVEAAYKAIPEAGFHMMLAGMGRRLRPDAFLGGRLSVPNIFRW